ncbi:hypothetical protein BSL78_14011 [Apostichopus japonicus]|uniref:CUB domain-containing protein n=1 Tax=Stichopus japonicus TaxID=307972 RepID=A0A2G8KM67_STIJA|nr:hypothetical protein BSL78_14011 [Apostichopus japonicus]
MDGFRDGPDPRGVRLLPDCHQQIPTVKAMSNAISIIFNSSSWDSQTAFKINVSRGEILTSHDETLQSSSKNVVTSSVPTTHDFPVFTISEVRRGPPALEHGRSDVGNFPSEHEEEVTEDSGFLQCFFQETSPSGKISSPDYPEKVEGPMCTWAITAFSSEIINIIFSDIDMGGRRPGLAPATKNTRT